MSVSFEEDLAAQRDGAQDAGVAGDANPGMSELLGDEEFTWTSPDGRLTCTFGRPRRMMSLTIARVLGPMQANNPVLDLYYKAAASIRSINGMETLVPSSDMHFDAIFARFDSDDTWNDFVNTFQVKLYPEAFEAIRMAAAEGYGPEAVSRILSNAGKGPAKKSRSRRSSSKS